MQWYLVKLVYRIICGDGSHTPQFDEQFRIINADDDLHAFQKARQLGHKEQDGATNDIRKPAYWKFIDVSELQPLSLQTDGAEVSSQVTEAFTDAESYIRRVNQRASLLLESSLQKALYLN